MTDFTNVFSGGTISPSRQAYVEYSLTADSTFNWPFNYSGSGYILSAITEISSSSGLTLTLPSAAEVSTGEDVLIKNVGGNSFAVVDADGGAVVTVASGEAKYLYVKDNSTSAGDWGVVSYGVGSSSVDASALIGYGIKAISTSLNQSHTVHSSSTGVTINTTYRASVLVHTGGVATYTFSAAATLGNDFFLLFRNEGTGVVTLDPNSSETIDSQTTISLQPGESCFIVCDGSELYTVGLSRNINYMFTQLVKDVSAGGPFTLSAIEASNKLLTFTGNPSATVEVTVPSAVAIYYVYNHCSTAQAITLKTSGGTSVSIAQTGRIIAFCDGTDVVSAQTVVSTTSINLIDGSSSSPSLNFATKTNTGLYKSSSQDLGIAVNGSSVAVFTEDGLSVTPSGNLAASNLQAALEELQTDIDTRALSGGVLTISGKTDDYTLVLGDAGSYIRMNKATANDLTVPANADVAFSTGTTIHIRQVGLGQTTIVAGSGVTINTPETLNLGGQGATVSITKVGTNEWDLYGNLELV